MAKKKQEAKEEELYTFSDDVTRNKIHKHLEDIKDVITDKDIKNVKVPGADAPSEPTDKDKNVLEGEVIKEEIEANTDNDKPITPWDVING